MLLNNLGADVGLFQIRDGKWLIFVRRWVPVDEFLGFLEQRV
jgi:hypothetical protein